MFLKARQRDLLRSHCDVECRPVTASDLKSLISLHRQGLIAFEPKDSARPRFSRITRDGMRKVERMRRDKRSAAVELKEAVEVLRDFREFVISNATQWRLGAGHHNPMWGRVAEVLDRHGENHVVPKNTFRVVPTEQETVA